MSCMAQCKVKVALDQHFLCGFTSLSAIQGTMAKLEKDVKQASPKRKTEIARLLYPAVLRLER